MEKTDAAVDAQVHVPVLCFGCVAKGVAGPPSHPIGDHDLRCRVDALAKDGGNAASHPHRPHVVEVDTQLHASRLCVLFFNKSVCPFSWGFLLFLCLLFVLGSFLRVFFLYGFTWIFHFIFFFCTLSQILFKECSKRSFLFHQVLVAALFAHLAVLEHDDVVGLWEEGHPMGHKNPCLSSQNTLWSDHLVKDVLAHVAVNCRKGVVQKEEIGITVHCSGHAHSLFLAARQVDPLFSYFRLIASRQDCQVSGEGTAFHNVLVPFLVCLEIEDDVLLQG